MSEKIDSLIEDSVEHAFQILTSGVSMAQSQEIDPQKIEALYALGHNYYTQKDFPKAEEIFAFAQRLDCLHLEIVKGLAAARKMQGKYDTALQAYALAGLLDMEEPTISFHAAECFFALGKYGSCGEALDAAAGLAEIKGDQQIMLKQIRKMKKSLKENI